MACGADHPPGLPAFGTRNWIISLWRDNESEKLTTADGGPGLPHPDSSKPFTRC